MKCLKCHMETDDNSKFCKYCGNAIEVVNQKIEVRDNEKTEGKILLRF